METKSNEYVQRIAGEKLQGSDTFIVKIQNPFSKNEIGYIQGASEEQVKKAISIGSKYQSKLTRWERKNILENISTKIRDNFTSLTNLITAETGLSLLDASHEVDRAADVFSLAASLCLIDNSQTYAGDIVKTGKNRRIFTHTEPVGLIAAITPFNHPLNMISHKIAPAIATNNCIVCKPSEKTPLTALRLADIIYDSGLPVEMLSILVGNATVIGQVFLESEKVEIITFTGSVDIGKYLIKEAGYKRVIVEMGGNSPLLVLEDANIIKAARLSVLGATKNSGQRCTAIKRIICVTEVAEELSQLIVTEAKKILTGDPLNKKTVMGTVINEGAAIKIENKVNNAIKSGATLLYGNYRDSALYHPTVLDNVKKDDELITKETFGPVIPIIRVNNINEAIDVANSTKYGLSCGICTNRMDYIIKCVKEIKTGSININEVPGYRTEITPFGGIKDSGLGQKEGLLEAMKLYTNIKTMSLPW